MKFIVASILLFYLNDLFSQTALETSQINNSAKVNGLGGVLISTLDDDLSLSFQNPAILDSVSAGTFYFLYNNYFADINYFAFSGSFNIKSSTPYYVGINYINFGNFEKTNEIGVSEGQVLANDYYIYLGKSLRKGPFSFGVNIKYASSTLEQYSSRAFLFDFGGIYTVPNNDLHFAIVVSNLGWVLKYYNPEKTDNNPLNLLLGISFKPQYMPIRFSFTYSDLLNKHNYLDNNSSTFNNVLYHFSFGGEFFLMKKWKLLLGYNHRKREDLKYEDAGGLSGFSYGIVMNFKKIEITFSRNHYSFYSATNYISLQTNLQRIKKKF